MTNQHCHPHYCFNKFSYFRNNAFIQFDSNLKNQDKFQKVTKSNTDKPFKKGKMDLEQQSLPEVSSERYYQTTKALGI